MEALGAFLSHLEMRSFSTSKCTGLKRKGNSAPALGLDLGLGFLPFPGGDDPQQEVRESPGIAVCLSQKPFDWHD